MYAADNGTRGASCCATEIPSITSSGQSLWREVFFFQQRARSGLRSQRELSSTVPQIIVMDARIAQHNV